MVGRSPEAQANDGADPVMDRGEPVDDLPASSSAPQAPLETNDLHISPETMGQSMRTVTRNRRCLNRDDSDALQDLVADAGVCH